MRFPSSSAERRLPLMVALAPGVNLSTSSHEAFRQLSLRIARVCTVCQCASTKHFIHPLEPDLHPHARLRETPSFHTQKLARRLACCEVVGMGWRRCATAPMLKHDT